MPGGICLVFCAGPSQNKASIFGVCFAAVEHGCRERNHAVISYKHAKMSNLKSTLQT